MTPRGLVVLLIAACFVTESAGLGQERSDAPLDVRIAAPVTLDSSHPFVPPAALADWEARASALRRQVLVAAGLWPMPPRAPLHASVHGRVERDGYSVEKVHFESLPGHLVTGSLYRPLDDPTVRHAGVLSPHGHWANGRFHERSEKEARAEIASGGEVDLVSARYHIQARCVQLARMGCVVFHHDMVGYADSRQLEHAAGFTALEAQLRGQSAFGLQTWNSIRALDFLMSLPDVDPERIGVTGASGGGTQTFVLCAIDDRPSAAFPAVMVSTRMQGGCICENASHLRVGTGNVELAALFAPRPLALSGANDWTVSVEEDALPPLRQVYALYGATDNVDAVCRPEFGHNYNLSSRTQMYRWFANHLQLEASTAERPFDPLTAAELSVFDEGHPIPEGVLDAAGLRDSLTVRSRAQLDALQPRDAEGVEEYQRIVGGALTALTHTTLPERVTLIDGGEFPSQATRVILRRSSGEACAAFITGAPAERVVVLVTDGPWDEALRARVDTYVRLGAQVVTMAPFMTEEYRRTFGVEDLERTDAGRHARFAGYSWGYNRTLLAERVSDILTAVAYASSSSAASVRLVGVGDAGGWVVLARALCGDAVERTACEWTWDFDQLTDVDDENFLPGALQYGGLAGFLGLSAPHAVTIAGDVPARAQGVYRAAGAEDALRSAATLDALTEWIAGR